MNVKDFEEKGFRVRFADMEPSTIDIIKSIFMDSIIAVIGGAHALPEDERKKIEKIMQEEPPLYRSVTPFGFKSGLEMAGFLNGYCVRYADWCDTQRQKVGRGGHPADMCAAMLTLCDKEGIAGEKIIEAIFTGYKMWSFIQNRIYYKIKGFDDVSILSMTIPVMTSICMHDDLEQMQNALMLSTMGGTIQIARLNPVTNMKCGASAYSIARAFFCYRMSNVLKAPEYIFDGKFGWYNLFEHMDGEFEAFSDADVFSNIQLKLVPCCNVIQAPVECALKLHEQLKGSNQNIEKIEIHICKADALIAIQPNQPQYPYDHPSADHHLRYCVVSALKFGDATPDGLFDESKMNDEGVRRLIDVTNVAVMDDDEFLRLGAENGACTISVTMKDGTLLRHDAGMPAGLMRGASGAELAQRMRDVVKFKRDMLGKSYHYDLSAVEEIVYHIEKYEGKALIDALYAAFAEHNKNELRQEA